MISLYQGVVIGNSNYMITIDQQLLSLMGFLISNLFSPRIKLELIKFVLEVIIIFGVEV